jgi:hypothetical protein
MNRLFIRNNTTSISIVIFCFLFFIIQLVKPSILYEKDGSLRPFGIGTKNKTILPIWLLSIILGILSYLVVIWYIALPKL